MRRTIRVPALIAAILAVLAVFGGLEAQVPTLNPDQTVSISNGSMGFALPLGTVKGMSGHDFPVNLYYHSGIRLDEEASAAGLGFSYEAGTITKKDVFVPDDNHGGDLQKYAYETGTPDHAKKTLETMQIFTICVAILCLVLSFIPSPTVAFFVGVAGMVMSTNTISSPADFSAGGSHCPSYTATDGQGFFNGGAAADLPDMYFVNSPLLNGEIVWSGGPGTEGHFVMKNTGGSCANTASTVKIDRKTDNNGYTIFEITLQDGTRLIFDKHDDMSRSEFTFYHSTLAGSFIDIYSCVFGKRHYKESVPVAWHLTKILYNDFVDGGGDANDPLDSRTSNKGGWISFTYDSIVDPNLVQAWRCSQAAQKKSAVVTRLGGYGATVKMYFLNGVITPNQTASYVYKKNGNNYTRKDNLWFDISNGAPVYMPALDYITINDHEGNTLRKTAFTTDYSLRPATFSAFKFKPEYIQNTLGHDFIDLEDDTKLQVVVEPASTTENPHAASLTLESITISDRDNKESFPISFQYLQWPEAFGYKTSWHTYNNDDDDNSNDDYTYTAKYTQQATIDRFELGYGDCHKEKENKQYVIFYPQMHDLWGYYLHDPEPMTLFRQFNLSGLRRNTFRSDQYPCIKSSDVPDATYNENTPWAAAWSMKELSLPDGMTIQWNYESNKYSFVNGVSEYAVDFTIVGGCSAPQPAFRYGGGIRVKQVTASTPHGKPASWSYKYENGYASALPYDFVENDRHLMAPASCYYRGEAKEKGGLYTPSKINYQKVRVTKNFNEGTGQAPVGYTEYEFTHSAHSDFGGYYPNRGAYCDVDCSWKRGLLRSVSVHDRTGKTIDSTFNGYSFVSESEADISYPSIEYPGLGVRGNCNEGAGTYYAKMQNGFIDLGWVKLDSVIRFHDGVRKKTGNTYCDGNPASKDFVSTIVPKSCMAYSAGSPGLTWNGNPCAIKTAAIRGTGAEADKITVFAARGELGGMGADINFQAISNVDVTDGTVDFTNARWSNNASFFLSNSSGSWLLTGLDAIDYNDNGYKNDLLFQFTDGYSIKLVIFPNVQVISGGSAISHDPMIQLRVVHSGSPYPLFRTNCTFPYIDPANLGSNTNCSAVCNLVSGSAIDMVFYCFDKDHTCLNNENPLFILQDVDLTDNTPFPGDDPGVKKAPYNEEQSIMACTGIKDEHNNYPVIGPHAKFLALDGGLQNDMVTAALIPGIISADTRIHDVVIKNLSVNPAVRTISYTGLDPTLGQTTVVANVDQYNWRSSYNSATNFFGLVAPDDLSWRIHLFQIPAGAGVYKTLLYGSYKETVVGDLDGQPNEVWTTAPNDKYLVTKAIPAYWKYPEMKIPHMLTQSCQTITYEKVAATPLSDADTKAAQATTWSNNRLYSPGPLGSILREYWTDIGSSNLVSALTSHPDFIANKASGAEFLPSFECPQNWADNYGQRVRGYVCPPQSGTYYFFLLSDDYSELWLSTDDNPANKRLIGSVTMQLSDGWGNARMSEGVTLVAGKYYYIEGLHKEADQVDFFKIGWILPDGTMTERPIPGNRLAPVTFNWLPSQTYAWNVPKNHAGVPLTTFSDFNFTTPPSQPNVWQLTGSVEKYDAASAPLETKNAKGISSTTVYRNDIHLPIASIANANHKECGVFTGDYNSGENAAYWDYSNGWMMGTPAQGGSVSLVSDAHFGEKVIKVRNNYAAGRNNVIIPGKSYRMTAWVKVETGKMLMAAGFHYVTGGTWPEVTLSTGDDGKAISADEVSTVGQWRLMRLDIPGSWTANFDASRTWVARAWVGNPKIAGSVGYVDDVRFRPVKSLVTSTYYDSKWQQPILSVDANNHPGRKVAYDDFGRPAEWWKIDAINPYLPKLVEEKCYHLMNEVTDDLFNPESYYKIVSVVDETKCIDIAGPVYANGQPVHMYTYAGNDNQQWKIVADGCGCYSILSLHDESFGIDDPDFTIANRTELRIWKAKGPAQKWRLIPNGDGTYKIASKANRSVVIDVRGGDDGTVANDDIVQLFADWNGSNQKWKIENVTP